MRVAVEVPAGAVVHSDRELVTLVLQNLVGNAVKYAARGTVRIAAEPHGDADATAGGNTGGNAGGWTLAVSDEGPGIAAEQLGVIFDAFRRGDVHGQGGVGLGLTIAARAAKLLDAVLTVESLPGAGSTFRLALPHAAGKGPSASDPPPAPPAAATGHGSAEGSFIHHNSPRTNV
jgi:signal transduction histidine kinase